MSIVVQCPSCHARFKAPDKAAGKRGRCPKCGAQIDVPHVPVPGAASLHSTSELPIAQAATSKTMHEDKGAELTERIVPPEPLTATSWGDHLGLSIKHYVVFGTLLILTSALLLLIATGWFNPGKTLRYDGVYVRGWNTPIQTVVRFMPEGFVREAATQGNFNNPSVANSWYKSLYANSERSKKPIGGEVGGRYTMRDGKIEFWTVGNWGTKIKRTCAFQEGNRLKIEREWIEKSNSSYSGAYVGETFRFFEATKSDNR